MFETPPIPVATTVGLPYKPRTDGLLEVLVRKAFRGGIHPGDAIVIRFPGVYSVRTVRSYGTATGGCGTYLVER
jgi:hypothetical protein